MIGRNRSARNTHTRFYSGSVAEAGARNPYRGRPVLAKLWQEGAARMLRVRIETGLAMQRWRNSGHAQRTIP